MEAPNPQRWARCPARLAWKRSWLPTDRVHVLERHPEPRGLAGHGWPLPGYVWLDTPGKVQHVPERAIEFTDDPSV